MTLPTLIQHHQKQVVETSLARFYSNFQQAVKLGEVEHGDKLYWDSMGDSCTFKDEDAETLECQEGSESTLVWFNKYLAPNMKTLKIKTDINQNSANKVSTIVYFTDGSIMALSINGINYYINEKAFKNRDNLIPSFGVHAFPFYWNAKKGLIPHPYTSGGGACSKNKNGAGCTQVIAENGWKIPKDYPFKF